MWILKHKSGDKFFYLNANKGTYCIGRNNADIQLKDDSSISRDHAKFIITISENDDKIVICDSGAKYGTYINEGIETKTPISPKIEIPLKHMDRVKFGILENIWTVIKVRYKTATSTLSTQNKTKIKNIVQSICGSCEETWSNTCTHLTMDNMTLTIKLVQALTAAVPIVTTKFWEELSSSVVNNTPLPKEELYIPAQAEPLVKGDSTMLLPNEDRKKIFTDKTFVFLSSRQFDQFHEIIKEANGKAALLEKLKWTKSQLCKPGVVVIQYIRSSYSQLSQTMQIMDDIEGYLTKKSHRLIPESEIGLAVLYCDKEKYCNPLYNFKINLLRPSLPTSSTNELVDILAEETEQINSERINDRVHNEKTKISNNQVTEKQPVVNILQEKSPERHIEKIDLTKYNIDEDGSDSLSKVNISATKANDSIITYNKTQKRKIDCTIDDRMGSSRSNVFDTDSPKRRCLDGDEPELFCFETNADLKSPASTKRKKTNHYKNVFESGEKIESNIVVSPSCTKTNRTTNLNDSMIKSTNTSTLNTITNLSTTILQNPKNWLSCRENISRIDAVDQKTMSENSTISNETQEWVSKIRDSISIVRKPMLRANNNVPKNVTKNVTITSEINYKLFKKQQLFKG